MSMQALDNLSQASETKKQGVSIDELIAQAETCLSQHQFEEAKALYSQVLESESHRAIANYGLGMIEANSATVLDGLPYFESAIKTDPNAEQYWVSYIDALMLSNQLEKAEQAVQLGHQYGLSDGFAKQLKDEISQQKHELKHTNLGGQNNIQSEPQEKNTLYVLIPAYKHQFLIPLVMGLRAQTYQNFKVVISDDSPDNEITKILSASNFSDTLNSLNIEIIEGPKQGPMTNIVHLIKHIQGASGLAHFLLDDDLIYPSFYEEHIKVHAKGNVGVSISYRWFVNEAGQPLAIANTPAFVKNNQNQVQSLETNELFHSVVPNCDNWLGEFSNAVFAIDQLHKFQRSCLSNNAYYGLGDVGFYLEIALSKEVMLIKNHLSGFRAHAQQNSLNIMSKTFKSGLLGWIAIAIDAYQLGKISIDQLNQTRHYTFQTISMSYRDVEDMKVFISLLEPTVTVANYQLFQSQFGKSWNTFLEDCNDWVSAQHINQASALAMSAC